MPRLTFRVGGIGPGDVWALDYQERGVNLGGSSWILVDAGLTAQSHEIDLSYRRDVLFRARVWRTDRVIPLRTLYANLPVEQGSAEQVPAPSSVEVAPQGTAIAVTVEAPSTPSAPAEPLYDVEVRAGAAVPEDSIPYSPAGVLADPPRTPYGCCGVPVPVCPGATTEHVHARLRRRSDGRPGPWLSVEPVLPPLDDYGEIVDDDATFAGTIEETEGWPHLEVIAGPKLQFAEIPGDDYTGTGADDDGDFPLDNMGARFTRGYYQPADKTHDQVVDWEPVICPTLDTLARDPILDDDTVHVPLPLAAEGEDPVDTQRLEIPDDSATHAEPPRLEVEIAETQDGAAYGAFSTYVPGRVRTSKGYRSRIHLASRLPLQIPVTSLLLRRRRRNRKWEFSFDLDVATGDKTYTFSPAPRVMSAASLRAAVQVVYSLVEARVNHEVRVLFVSATAIRVMVAQVVRAQVVTLGGAVVWTYPAAFGNTPQITCSPSDALQEAFAGYHSSGATQATIYTTDHSGAAVDKAVDCHAIGPPANGAVAIHVVLTGY